MIAHAFVLAFMICSSGDPFLDSERCEEGYVRARSCEAAEQFIRAGLRPGQTFHIAHCMETEDE
jgi:hypothetical protein